jgi:hypothetical protein
VTRASDIFMLVYTFCRISRCFKVQREPVELKIFEKLFIKASRKNTKTISQFCGLMAEIAKKTKRSEISYNIVASRSIESNGMRF